MNARPPRSDFFGIARHNRIAVPNTFRATDDEWGTYCRVVWAKHPPWAFDRDFVAELASEHLPRVLAQIGIAKMLGRIARDSRAIVGRGAPLAAMPLGGDGRWMMLRLGPPDADLLALDSWSHAWRCPSLDQMGDDLIDLGAWRWGVSPGKAAFRIARICGHPRPVP